MKNSNTSTTHSTQKKQEQARKNLHQEAAAEAEEKEAEEASKEQPKAIIRSQAEANAPVHDHSVNQKVLVEEEALPNQRTSREAATRRALLEAPVTTKNSDLRVKVLESQ